VSRRRERRRQGSLPERDPDRAPHERDPDRAPHERDPDRAPRERDASAARILRDVLLLVALFGVTVGVAELAGAANLGVSFGIGQIVFAIGLVVLLTRG